MNRHAPLSILLAATALSCIITTHPLQSAETPKFQPAALKLTARGEDIGDFLKAMFDVAGVPVAVSPAIRGKVNGQFAAPVGKLWADLSRAFDLVGYYDGATFFVYSRGEIGRRKVYAANPQAVVQEVRRLRLVDRDHTANAGPMAVEASGTPAFLGTIDRLASTVGAVRDLESADRPPVRIPSAPLGRPRTRGGSASALNPSGAHETRVYYLRYARVDDTELNTGSKPIVIRGLASVLRDIMGTGASVGTAVTIRYGADRSPYQPRRADALVQRPNGLDEQDADYLGVREGVATPEASGTQRAGPRPSISSVQTLNALVVRDLPENMATYDALIRALDIEPRIVEIEATIIDIDLDRVRELGIDWRIQTQGFGALLGNDVVQRVGDPRVDGNVSGALNRGLEVRGAIGPNNELVARFQALEQRGAAHIVSKPRLITLSDAEAAFDRTRTFNVRVPGNRQSDLFSVSAGTTLRVNPHVLADGGAPRIRLSVVIEDGSIERASVDNIPIVERARVATETLIGEGESLLLGGLTVDSRIDALSQVPGLGDVPILGNVFKTKRKQRRRIERLFLITPRVGSLDSSVPISASVEGAPKPMPFPPGTSATPVNATASAAQPPQTTVSRNFTPSGTPTRSAAAPPTSKSGKTNKSDRNSADGTASKTENKP